MMLVEAALRSERPKPLTSQTLHVIHGELIRLQHTVQAFLDFARPPALQPTAVDLHGVVEHAVELVRARALQQRVTLKVSGASDPIVAMIDRGQIEIVLVNLLLNALDAMPDGGHLVVGLERNAQSSVCLSVTDSGKGIAPEILDRLFIPFVSNKPTGTGLGLSISRRIIEQHGGCMTAANQPQGGARFTITLPGIILEGNHAHAPGD
jgi:signal transduction histidine kinase